MAEIAQAQLRKFVDEIWRDEVVPTLTTYIAIPNKSPSFEPEWEKLGHMERAVEMFVAWATKKLPALPGATLSVERLPGRTPLIFIDVPGQAPGGEGSDFVSRLFAPAIGIDEDPVTGSAHCALGPFWAERLGREVLTARQTGPRPGALQVRTGSAAPGAGRVGLEGRARPFVEGVLYQ